jgi:hypothetical protein
MGCLLFKHESLSKTLATCLRINDVSVEIFTGNPFNEKTDVLVVLTNDLVKFDLQVLNKDSVLVLQKCFQFLERRKSQGKQNSDDKIFVVEGRTARKIVFATVPWFIDGTLGEQDYLSQALAQAFSISNEESVCIYIDCVYPKSLFVKDLLKQLKNSLLFQAKRKIVIYSNNIQIVMNIQRYLLNLYSNKMGSN